MDEQGIQRVTSHLWSPLVAITTAHGGQANGQIAVSALNASILSDHPRVLIDIWKANYTHHLIAEGGIFALHLLGEQNLHLIEQLGMRSGWAARATNGSESAGTGFPQAALPEGRDGDKLAGLRWETRLTGAPILLDTLGYVEARVIGQLDAGDMTCFLGSILDGALLNAGDPLTWPSARARLPADLLARYETHQQHQREVARGLLEHF